jgi:hypothetical protein
MPQSKRSIFSKLLIICAASLLLGIGLCGLDYFLASRGIGKSTQEFGVGPLDGVSLLTMFLSALGLVLTFVAWVITLTVRSLIAKPADREPTRLFDQDDKDQ